MSRVALAGLVLCALAGPVAANGRPAATSTINFRHGHPMDIVAGMTFGLVITHDGGQTWHWMCEDAVGYGGMYDPVYAYSDSGAIFATTFSGLKVNRDSCSFDSMPSGPTFASQVYIPPGTAHTVFYTASQAPEMSGSDMLPGDSNIYKSTDDGTTFPTTTMPGEIGDWWSSIVTAPSDATRMYLSGYKLTQGQPRTFMMLESTDGGASFTPASTTGMTTSNNSAVYIVGISPTSPDVVFARVTLENGSNGESLYRSTDAGQTWTKMLDKPDLLSFVARANGTCVASAQTLGAWVSTDCDDPAKTPTWTALVNPPHINCLVESASGEVWACTQNFGSPGLPSDGYGIMKTTDLATWTGVLKFQDIAGPVVCPGGALDAGGTVQHDTCQETVWCGLKMNLGITSTVIDCPSFTPDNAPDATAVHPGTKPKGCCDTSGAGAPGALFVSALVGLACFGPRRRRRRA